MRLINFNFSQQPETNVTTSSYNVNYPGSNIKHEFRSKQWRSNFTGNFLINSLNDKIDFKESLIGSELTATIPSGTYTSTTLVAEIKIQLDAVGSDTYTVSYNQTNGLWTIASDGSYLSLLNNTGTNQAASILKNSLGFANSDRTGDVSYTGSNTAIHTSEWILFDMVTIEEIDSVVLLWPKEDGIGLSSSAVVKIQANATNTWAAPAVNETLNVDNVYELFSHYFSTSQNYRYWRVVIEDPTNQNLYVNLGVVILGKSASLDNPDNGFNFNAVDKSQITSTEFGHQYVDEYPTYSSLEINFNVLDYSVAEVMDNIFRQNGIRTPVFITMDHESTVYNKNHYALYGKFKSELQMRHLHYDIFQSGLVITEIA